MSELREWSLFLMGCLVILNPASPVIFNGEDVYAVEGERLVIPCRLHEILKRPAPKIYGKWSWRPTNGAKETILSYTYSNMYSVGRTPMAARFRMAPNAHSGNYTLEIQLLRKMDEGTIECDFQHNSERANKLIRLHILQVVTNASSPMLEGEKFSLSCLASWGPVSWSGPRGLAQSGQVIVIDLMPARDPQTFTCTVKHAAGSLQASRRLEVVGFMKSPPPSLYISPGSRAMLPCILNQLPRSRDLSMSWFRDGTDVLAANISGTWHRVSGTKEKRLELLGGNRLGHGDLSIQISPHDSGGGGEYGCRMSLGTRSISRSVRVTVIEVSSSPPGTVRQGTKVELTCRVSPNAIVTRMVWRHSERTDKNLTEAAEVKSVHRTFPSIHKSDEGVWVCELFVEKSLVATRMYRLNITDSADGAFLPIIQANLPLILGLAGAVLLILVLVSVMVVCLVKRNKRRRRAVRRLRHPLCREHSHQLSNQPLFQGNEYIDANRPLPRPPNRRCPHNPPRRDRSSYGNPKRSVGNPSYST